MEKVLFNAELEFPNRKDANDFAIAWSRHTLSGHTVGSDGTISIYGVTEDNKEWISEYIKKYTEDNQ
jgi:hypothetical protein